MTFIANESYSLLSLCLYQNKSCDKVRELASTQTFEDYLAQPNPLPMVETLPHLNAQPNLPRTYQLEIGGQTLHYEIQYQLRADGLPTQRTLRGGANTETTTYVYQ